MNDLVGLTAREAVAALAKGDATALELIDAGRKY